MAHGKPLHALTEEHTTVGFNIDRVVINTHKIGFKDQTLKKSNPGWVQGVHNTKTGVTKSLRSTTDPDIWSERILS